jgi:DNA-directed RNA polymerase subunit RPC12/RpoP
MRLIWSITAHVCVNCMGRILERPLLAGEGIAPGRERVYRCADCGLERDGFSPAVLCTCGLKLKGRHNLGLRCEANLERTPEFPAEIIARQA